MIQARSIGKRAGEIVDRPPVWGRVLASFVRVCDLLTDGGRVFALAWDGVKNGPLNILLDNQPGAALPAGTRFVVSGTGIRFLVDPPVQIELAGARVWDARPDWSELIERGERIAAGARILASVLAAEAPQASLARAPIRFIGFPVSGAEFIRHGESRAPYSTCRMNSAPDPSNPLRRIDGSAARPASETSSSTARALESAHLPVAAHAIADVQTAYAHNDIPALGAAASRLCGLGPGLTPAGDDWLAGWLIGLRLRGEPSVDAIGEAVVTAAWKRTTVLSRALLACAAAGEVDENWQALLSALAAEHEIEIVAATRSILAQGATSGADMLAGFLTGLMQATNRLDFDQAKTDHDRIIYATHQLLVQLADPFRQPLLINRLDLAEKDCRGSG